MAFTLTDRVALVTGGGSGIGAASAKALAGAGARVAVTDINADAAESVAAELREGGADAISVALDVSDESQWIDAVKTVNQKLGTITVAHSNAAGFGRFSEDVDVLHLEVEIWDETFAVVGRGSMLAAKHILPDMLRAGGGSLVYTSSIKGITGSSLRPAYSASKGVINSLVLFLAAAYGPHGVRCNAIAPGLVETPAFRAQVDPERQKTLVGAQMVHRPIQPEHIADTVLFLASDAAASVTGQIIVVDAGMTAQVPVLSPPVEGWPS